LPDGAVLYAIERLGIFGFVGKELAHTTRLVEYQYQEPVLKLDLVSFVKNICHFLN
jgi:hypothetical protein